MIFHQLLLFLSGMFLYFLGIFYKIQYFLLAPVNFFIFKIRGSNTLQQQFLDVSYVSPLFHCCLMSIHYFTKSFHFYKCNLISRSRKVPSFLLDVTVKLITQIVNIHLTQLKNLSTHAIKHFKFYWTLLFFI